MTESVIEQLCKRTWALQYNPNFKSPFLVRLVGKRAGVIDYQVAARTKDILGAGKTLDEAGQIALEKARMQGCSRP